MIKKYLSIFLVGLLLFSADSALILAQTKTDNNASNVEKIKANVLERGTGEKKRVRVKMLDGTKMKGYISQAGEDSFTLTDSKTKQTTVIAYRDAARVEDRGLAGGAKIGIWVGVAAAATLIVLYIAFQNAIRDN
ncbi:MAG: hypothetical protein H0W77_11880 [Acidobacteria bacterium]|nr:hypothetical protein [Acidobacteriota bacterium]